MSVLNLPVLRFLSGLTVTSGWLYVLYMDRQHTTFGKVVEVDEVIDQIRKDDVI